MCQLIADVSSIGVTYLILDLLVSISDFGERVAGSFNLLLLHIPTRAFRDERDLDDNEKRHEQLKDDDHLPVPLSERCCVFGAGEVDPVCDE